MCLEGQLWVKLEAEPLGRALFDRKRLLSDLDSRVSCRLEDRATLAEHEDLSLADLKLDFVVRAPLESVSSNACQAARYLPQAHGTRLPVLRHPDSFSTQQLPTVLQYHWLQGNSHLSQKKEFSTGWRLMPETTVFLLDIIDSNSLHGPVRELHQENGISNQIKLHRASDEVHLYVVPAENLSLATSGGAKKPQRLE